MDAEGCERAWANLNQAAGSTSEKGHGSRIDTLNHCMQDWNWKKTIGMGKIMDHKKKHTNVCLKVSFLLKKHAESRRMAADQRSAWEAFDESVDSKLTRDWSKLSTDPQKTNGRWTSVFLMSTAPGK